MKRRVVVTGFGLVTPLGCKADQYWSKICNAESGIGPIRSCDVSAFRSQIAGEATDFSTDPYMVQRDASRIERFAQMSLTSAIDAVGHSGLDFSTIDPYRAGAIIASGVGGLEEIEAQHDRMLEKGPKHVSVFTIPKMMINAASGNVTMQYGLKGPSYGVVSACASAAHAIIDAYKTIQCDEADVIISGGSEAAVTRLGIAGFCAMRALSFRNDEPERASRPFDADRDGFVMGEGAGILVLEELEHARRRGATILAEILGYGMTSDALHITQPDPTGDGAARAMKNALQNAGLDGTQVDYINAHGTSTKLGDAAETVSIKRVFGDHAKKVSISSTKSQIGHLLGASAGVELITSIMAITHGVVPPTINYETPDPECDLDYTPNTPREKPISTILSNSFGFGGHNAVLIAGKLR